MNLNYTDLNDKGFNIICSVLDKYCVHYTTRVNTREILFECNSNYEIHTQELKPDAYIFVKDKIEEQLALIAKLDYQHDLPAKEPNTDKQEKQDSGLTLADLIERNMEQKRNVFEPFNMSNTQCSSNSALFDKSTLDAEEEKKGYNLFSTIKDLIINSAEKLKETLHQSISGDMHNAITNKITNVLNDAQKKNIIRSLSDEVCMTYEELPTDLKEILLTQLPLSFLKHAKFNLVKNSNGFAISIDGDNE